MARKVFIVDAKRTPLGSFGGGLLSIGAIDLAATVVEQLVQSIPVSSLAIDEIVMGCVLQAGLGQAPARQVAKKVGLPDTVVATTVTKCVPLA